jgi:hypothetical protein
METFARLNREFKGNSGRRVDFERICKRYLKEKPETVEQEWREFVRTKAAGGIAE